MKSKSVTSNNPLKSVILTDIVKAHGGELKLSTSEKIGTEFQIILPIQ